MRMQFICLALIAVLFCPIASVQWVQSNLPYRLAYYPAVSGTNLFAGTVGGGVRVCTLSGLAIAQVPSNDLPQSSAWHRTTPTHVILKWQSSSTSPGNQMSSFMSIRSLEYTCGHISESERGRGVNSGLG